MSPYLLPLVGQLGEVLGRYRNCSPGEALPGTGPGHAGGGHGVEVRLVAWAEYPVLQGIGQPLQGMAPHHDVTGAGQQLPAAVGLVSPPAAAAVALGVSVPAVEAMPMATAGARSIEVGVPGAGQESVGNWSLVAVAAHLMVGPPASLPGIAGRFLPGLCVMLIEDEGGW